MGKFLFFVAIVVFIAVCAIPGAIANREGVEKDDQRDEKEGKVVDINKARTAKNKEVV